MIIYKLTTNTPYTTLTPTPLDSATALISAAYTIQPHRPYSLPLQHIQSVNIAHIGYCTYTHRVPANTIPKHSSLPSEKS